jgi:membrane-associated protease RseP (regulator of RpoE activity)
MGIISMLIILAITIAIHEFGHYWFMKRNQIEVEEFTIGFGPTLWEKQLKSGTWFRIKLLWLGGYAKPSATGQKQLATASGWVQFKVFIGGMLMNAKAAFVVFLAFGYITGKMPVVILPYIEWAPAWLAPAVAAFLLSFGLWLATPVIIVMLLVKLGLGFFAQAAGPIGIFHASEQMAQAAPTTAALVSSMVLMFALINSSIAGFNLMPLLPFDGGHILGIILRKLVGPKHAKNAMRFYGWISAIIFIFLVIMIFKADIMRLITGGSLIPSG